MEPWYMVCSNEGKCAGIAGSAYGIFPTRAQALRFILANGLRRIAYITEA